MYVHGSRVHVHRYMVNTFWDFRAAKPQKSHRWISHWPRQSMSTISCLTPLHPQLLPSHPWLPIVRPKTPSVPAWVCGSWGNPVILSHPPSQMRVIYLSLDQTDVLTIFLRWSPAWPLPSGVCKQFASTLKLCSLNTLFGSSVGPLQLLKLGFGYRLLPTESEGTKSQIRMLKKNLKRTGEQDHKVFMEICL